MTKSSMMIAMAILVSVGSSNAMAQIGGWLGQAGGKVNDYVKPRLLKAPSENYSRLGGPSGLVENSGYPPSRQQQFKNEANQFSQRSSQAMKARVAQEARDRQVRQRQIDAQRQVQLRKQQQTQAIVGAVGGIIGGIQQANERRQQAEFQQQQQYYSQQNQFYSQRPTYYQQAPQRQFSRQGAAVNGSRTYQGQLPGMRVIQPGTYTTYPQY